MQNPLSSSEDDRYTAPAEAVGCPRAPSAPWAGGTPSILKAWERLYLGDFRDQKWLLPIGYRTNWDAGEEHLGFALLNFISNRFHG